MKALDGMVAVVTGGTSGIGFHTATALARLGASTTITGRDEARGNQAAERIRTEVPGARVRFEAHDAATIAGNRALAGRLERQGGRIDILVNNVGGLYAKRWTTAEGHEATLAMNVLGPAALTHALAPQLWASPAARVVNLASSAHSMWRRDPFDDVQSERSYVGMIAYGRAKLLNILWSRELAARWAGRPVTVTAVNPGMAWTNMTAAMDPGMFPWWMRFAWPILRRSQQGASPEAAARSSIVAAVGDELPSKSGLYVEKDGSPAAPSARARSESLAAKTWTWLAEIGATGREQDAA
jgi:retinol dehydrogenase 12